jgi:thiamine phosphate synthase YjbQ (UPF0047 family)
MKAVFCGPSVQIPYIDGELLLGQWQGIYFADFDGPRQRNVVVSLMASSPPL